ncbi:unnamed protein product [Paramecium sonneborni]|uniref:Uncharacterized protein n=1 Tax=Paramecium sonneborni TaxID=65129 RepID=A0A8S1RAD0_9CILI|nr:unnamed protein product [Paramecium sonneborni]
MLNLFYGCDEVYSFENKEEISKTLDFDQFGQMKLDFINKCITYKIDRRKFIRLRDLIFWIESGFVMIHLGQLLQLIINLLRKVQIMESKEIEHNYLNTHRIWLQLTQNSQYPNLIYQFLYYTIHFTGYQCPFYENQIKPSMKASHQINKIIIFIINRCYNSIHLKWTNLQKRNEIFEEILQPIINLCKSNSTSFEIITFIKEILMKYNYQDDQKNKMVQSLQIDDNYNDYFGSDRQELIPKINKDLTSMIEFGSQYGQIVLEFLLQNYIPIITQHLSSISKIKFDYMMKCQEQHNILQKRECKLKQQINQLVQYQIKDNLQEYEKNYKFEITQQEMKQLEKDIIDQVFQSKFVQYFNNTYWLHSNNPDIDDAIYAIISKNIIEPVSEKIEKLFMYKIMLLIDQVI